MKIIYICFLVVLLSVSPALAVDDCAEHGFCDAPAKQPTGTDVRVRVITKETGQPGEAPKAKTPAAISFGNNKASGSSFNPSDASSALGVSDSYGEPADREFIMKYSDSPEVYGDMMKAEMPVMGQ